jgi:ankyrin repeat protein
MKRLFICFILSAGVFKPAKGMESKLFTYVRSGQVDQVKEELNKGADVNQRNPLGETALFLAVDKGAEKIVELLLADKKTDVNLSDPYGNTPLIQAVSDGRGNIVKMLLAAGVDVNVKDKVLGGVTALQVAVSAGNEDMVKLLLADKKIDVNLTDDTGSFPLFTAVLLRNKNIVQALLNAGANREKELVKRDSKMTALQLAQARGDTDMVKLLQGSSLAQLEQKKESDVTVQSPNEMLVEHARLGKVDEMREDLKKGADINYVDLEGVTALISAILGGQEKAVKFLLADKKIDVNFATEEGLTPLMNAVTFGHKNIVQDLLNAGADKEKIIDLLGKKMTAIQLAQARGDAEIVKMLQNNVPAVMITIKPEQKKESEAALIAHVRAGKIKEVQEALKQGVDVNQRDEHGLTALLLAAINGYEDIVKLLLADKKIDVNLANKQGYTPLMRAAYFGHKNIVQDLLNAGANKQLVNDQKKTALQLAQDKGRTEIVKLLQA